MIIVCFTLIPLTCAVLLLIFQRFSEKTGGTVALLATLVLLILSVHATGLIAKSSGLILYHMGGWKTPLGIDLVMDNFSVLMLIVVNLVSFATVLFSIQYMRRYTALDKYYVLLLFLVASLNGVVLSGDIFNLYVFIEMASLASYSLVAFGVERPDLEASIRYQVLGTVGSFFILLGIGLIYGALGTLDLAHMSTLISSSNSKPTLMLSIPLLMFGFSLKAALVPFHAWLPDAHPTAPSPISAMLSGVVIKVLSLYGIGRIFFGVFGMTYTLSQVLLYAGLISIFFGALAALGQTDFKRLLAYSSISQIGYIMFGLGLGTPMGIAGALFHLLNHATFKSLYFFCAGATEYATGTREINKLGGLSEKMPVTCGASLFASFSLAGIPPFGGFWSKLLIIFAAILSGNLVLGILVASAGLLTMGYFLKIQRGIFFSKLPEGLKSVKEVPWMMAFAMVFMALLCLGIGLIFPYILSHIVTPAANDLIAGTGYGQKIMGMQ